MILTTKEDIEASIEDVFAALCDFESFERAALRRGADVVRTDAARADGSGLAWRTAFAYRGKRRVAKVVLERLEAPALIQFRGTSRALDGTLRLDLVALSRNRTRVTVTGELVAKTLASRIFLQSLKLARGRITDRFVKRVRTFAMGIEDRLRKPTLG